MKKYIKASVESVPGNDVLSEIYVKLQEIQDYCSYLEDYLFGSDAVSEITKCYKLAEKAINCIDKATGILLESQRG